MRKIYILIFLFIIASIYFRKNIQDNYINEPYIIVKNQNGLNNRLWTLLGYLHFANSNNKKLKFIWIKDDHCPGNFNDIFENIPNVEIIDKDIPFDIQTFGSPSDQWIKDKYFRLLKPKSNIQKNIDLFKEKLQYNYIACHIRRTDIIGQDYVKKHTTDEDYINFINQHDSSLKIFIATDNKNTQDYFKSIYNNRIICKDIIPSKNLRQTSLEDAIVDMYVCAGSKYFLGYEGSTFSININLIREANN